MAIPKDRHGNLELSYHPFMDKGHWRDGTIYCMDPVCPECREAIDLREAMP